MAYQMDEYAVETEIYFLRWIKTVKLVYRIRKNKFLEMKKKVEIKIQKRKKDKERWMIREMKIQKIRMDRRDRFSRSFNFSIFNCFIFLRKYRWEEILLFLLFSPVVVLYFLIQCYALGPRFNSHKSSVSLRAKSTQILADVVMRGDEFQIVDQQLD